MPTTRFWLLRHAIVAENARAVLYGRMDVPLCPEQMVAQADMYKTLAARLPRPAIWLVTPLSRTQHTAANILRAGYPKTTLAIEAGLIEQHLGEWQGLPHADLPEKLRVPAHGFWPLAGHETPPGGESMTDVLVRVGSTLETLAAKWAGRDLVAVSHGGAIRAAVAHAMGVDATAALHLSVQNLSLTVLEHHPQGWRVVVVNDGGL